MAHRLVLLIFLISGAVGLGYQVLWSRFLLEFIGVSAYSYATVLAFFMAGLHERDPLLPVLRQWRALSYTSRLYVVHWPDGRAVFEQLDQRPPYLELGSL